MSNGVREAVPPVEGERDLEAQCDVLAKDPAVRNEIVLARQQRVL